MANVFVFILQARMYPSNSRRSLMDIFPFDLSHYVSFALFADVLSCEGDVHALSWTDRATHLRRLLRNQQS